MELRGINTRLKSAKNTESLQKDLFKREKSEEIKKQKEQKYQETKARREALDAEKVKIISKEKKVKDELDRQVKKLQQAEAAFKKVKGEYDDMTVRLDIVLRDHSNKIGELISRRNAKSNFSLAIIDALSGTQKFSALKGRFEKLAREPWIAGRDRSTIGRIVTELSAESIVIADVVKLLNNLIDEEDREQGNEAIDNIRTVFESFKEENVQFIFIRDEFVQTVAKYKKYKAPVFGSFYTTIKSKYPDKWGTSDRSRRVLENMYRVPDSDLMWIGVSREEELEARMKGGGVQDVFLKKFRISEQDVWNMLEPYGILLTIFNKAINTKATLEDVLGSLKLAMGYAKDDPGILGEIEGLDEIIKMHIKYRLSRDM